jgi:hypothetical protein
MVFGSSSKHSWRLFFNLTFRWCSLQWTIRNSIKSMYLSWSLFFNLVLIPELLWITSSYIVDVISITRWLSMLVATNLDATYQRWPSSRACDSNSPTSLSSEWRRMSADVASSSSSSSASASASASSSSSLWEKLDLDLELTL